MQQHSPTGKTSGFTTIWVDITRPSPYFDRPNPTAHKSEWLCASQPAMRREAGRWDQQGTLMQQKQQRAHYSVSRRSARGELTLPPTRPARTASPQEVCSRLQTTDAGEGRGILSSWPMQRCQEVQKLLISGRGCIEMRFPAGELRISAEPGFPACVFVFVWVNG